MKMEQVNAWLGFAGNIAILLGLVAVAIQINDNTAAVRAQELGAIAEQVQQRQHVLLDSDVRALYVKSLVAPAELTLEDLQGMTAYLSIRVGHLRRTYQAWRSGILQPEDWAAHLQTVPVYLATPFGRAASTRIGRLSGVIAVRAGRVNVHVELRRSLGE